MRKVRARFMTPPRTPHGFTLIEILTVLAVTAILAVLLIAGLGKARETAQAAEAVSQMRQIFTAANLFAAENGGQLPKVAADNVGLDDPTEFFFVTENGVARTEDTVLAKYLGGAESALKILQAPADEDLTDTGRNFSYSFNFLINKGELLEGASGPSGFEKALGTVNLSYLPDPSGKVLIYEEETPNDSFCVWFIDRPAARYGDKSHVGYADGHVDLLPADDIFGNSELGDFVPGNLQY